MSNSQDVQANTQSRLTTEPLSEEAESGTIAILLAEDFQRIGIQPKETRSAVIRRAASRTSKSLARRQLSTPSRATEEQLSQVAVSTYRLLDPRQRSDDHDRAHVGRIRPGTLLSIERIGFARKLASEAENPSGAQFDLEPTECDELSQPASPRPNNHISHEEKEPADSPSLNSATSGQFLLSEFPTRQTRIAWLRNSMHQPPFLIALIVVVATTAAALWAGISFPIR